MIWGFHSIVDADWSMLGYNTVPVVKKSLTYLKTEALRSSKSLIINYQSTQHHILEDFNLQYNYCMVNIFSIQIMYYIVIIINVLIRQDAVWQEATKCSRKEEFKAWGKTWHISNINVHIDMFKIEQFIITDNRFLSHHNMQHKSLY
jgi:hypothetical protein